MLASAKTIKMLNRAALSTGRLPAFSVPARQLTCARKALICNAVTETQAEHTGVSPAASRRSLLAGAATVAAALSSYSTYAGNASAECELKTASNGLQFCDLKEGTGEPPAKGSLIRCHYTGRLASNGRVFDSSYERGRPLTFKVGVREVIPGWDLGILGTDDIPPMKAGGKRLLVIPPELAYGSRGAGGVIPPNATLEFEVELLGKPGAR